MLTVKALIVAILAGGGAYLYMRSRARAHSKVAREVLEARWRSEREAELAEVQNFIDGR